MANYENEVTNLEEAKFFLNRAAAEEDESYAKIAFERLKPSFGIEDFSNKFHTFKTRVSMVRASIAREHTILRAKLSAEGFTTLNEDQAIFKDVIEKKAKEHLATKLQALTVLKESLEAASDVKLETGCTTKYIPIWIKAGNGRLDMEQVHKFFTENNSFCFTEDFSNVDLEQTESLNFIGETISNLTGVLGYDKLIRFSDVDAYVVGTDRGIGYLQQHYFPAKGLAAIVVYNYDSRGHILKDLNRLIDLVNSGEAYVNSVLEKYNCVTDTLKESTDVIEKQKKLDLVKDVAEGKIDMLLDTISYIESHLRHPLQSAL